MHVSSSIILWNQDNILPLFTEIENNTCFSILHNIEVISTTINLNNYLKKKTIQSQYNWHLKILFV